MVAYKRNKLKLPIVLLMCSYSTFGYVLGSTDGNDCMQYRMIEKLVYLENHNSKLVDKIAKLEQQRIQAVSAYVRLSNSVNLKLNERVMYDTEISNIGGAFNFKTSQFITPVSGIYFVSVTACLSHDQYSNLDIMKDGLKIGIVRSGDGALVDCSSATLSIHLELGDNIWVESGSPSADGSKLFEGRGWNTFTAALIHAD